MHPRMNVFLLDKGCNINLKHPTCKCNNDLLTHNFRSTKKKISILICIFSGFEGMWISFFISSSSSQVAYSTLWFLQRTLNDTISFVLNLRT